jgi:hypothetical protein
VAQPPTSDENQMGKSEFPIGFEDFPIKTSISSRYFPLPCLITGGYTLKLGNLLAIYGKTEKSRGLRTALRNHSCWCIVDDVGTCWQMLADVGMYDFESSLAKNELGRWLPHDDLVVFQEEKQFYK